MLKSQASLVFNLVFLSTKFLFFPAAQLCAVNLKTFRHRDYVRSHTHVRNTKDGSRLNKKNDYNSCYVNRSFKTLVSWVIFKQTAFDYVLHIDYVMFLHHTATVIAGIKVRALFYSLEWKLLWAEALLWNIFLTFLSPSYQPDAGSYSR